MKFGDARNQLLDELFRTGQLTSQAHTYINKAIDFYKKTPTYFNEEVSTAQTVAGEEYFDLPIDYGSLQSLTLQVDTNEYRLIHRTMQEMDDMYVSADNYTGYPQDFCIFRNQIRLGPVPDQAYTLKMAYRRYPETASASHQVNIWLDNEPDLIIARAAQQMCFKIIQDVPRGQVFKMEEKEYQQEMTSTTARKVMRGYTKGRN